MKKVARNPKITIENGVLLLDRVPAVEIVRQFGTPCFVFLEDKIRINCQKLKNELELLYPKFELFYSVKANYLAEICCIVREEGYGGEIITPLEYHHLKALGFAPSEIIAGGPYLPADFLSELLFDQVREITFFNYDSLKILSKYTVGLGRKQKISLSFSPLRYGRRLGFKPELDEINQIKSTIESVPNVILKTLSCHYGTQIVDFDPYLQNFKKTLEILGHFEQSGLKIETLNLGGGFPEANALHRDKLRDIIQQLKDLLHQFGYPDLVLRFEPGRYIVGDSGIILSQVYSWEASTRWAFVNVGNNLCPKFAKAAFRFFNVTRPLCPNEHKINIGGVIPTDQDVLVKNYSFTDCVDVGDIIAILNAGAYTITFSNRFPYSFPPVILVKRSSYLPIIKLGQLPDIL